MKKVFTLLAGALLLSQSTISALLPPLAESIRELQTMLEDKQFAANLGMAEPIEEIKVVKDGYLVSTRSQQLLVKVNYHATKRIGPAEFDLQFEMLKKKDRNEESKEE
jgi:hypothetical protein